MQDISALEALRVELIAHASLLVRLDFLEEDFYFDFGKVALQSHSSFSHCFVLHKVQAKAWTLRQHALWLDFVANVEQASLDPGHLEHPQLGVQPEADARQLLAAVQQARRAWLDQKYQALGATRGPRKSKAAFEKETASLSAESQKLLSILKPRAAKGGARKKPKMSYARKVDLEYNHFLAVYWALAHSLSFPDEDYTPDVLDRAICSLQKIAAGFDLEGAFLQCARRRLEQITVAVMRAQGKSFAQVLDRLESISQSEGFPQLATSREAPPESQSEWLPLHRRSLNEQFSQLKQMQLSPRVLDYFAGSAPVTEEFVQLGLERLRVHSCDAKDHLHFTFFLAALGRRESLGAALWFLRGFDALAFQPQEVFQSLGLLDDLEADAVLAGLQKVPPSDCGLEAAGAFLESSFRFAHLLLLRRRVERGATPPAALGDWATAVRLDLVCKFILSSSFSTEFLPQTEEVTFKLQDLGRGFTQTVLAKVALNMGSLMQKRFFCRVFSQGVPVPEQVARRGKPLALGPGIQARLEAQNTQILKCLEWFGLLLEIVGPDACFGEAADAGGLKSALEHCFFLESLSQVQFEKLKQILERAERGSVLAKLSSVLELGSIEGAV